MAEFKKLSDVEVVAEPMESANVLIEENGVIKKTPKTAVGGAGGGAVQADFSQNDTSAPDYVKNRPCYTEIEKFTKDVQTELMTINAFDWGGSYDCIVAELGTVVDIFGYNYSEFTSLSIIYDGQEYNNLIEDYVVIVSVEEDVPVWKFYNSENSPYIIKSYTDGIEYLCLVTPEGEGSHSIEFIAKETVHKLDEKYVPSTFDMVLSYKESTLTIESGSFEAIHQKLQNGDIVEVALFTLTDATGYCAQRSTSVEKDAYSSTLNITFLSVVFNNTLQIRKVTIAEDFINMSTREFDLESLSLE